MVSMGPSLEAGCVLMMLWHVSTWRWCYMGLPYISDTLGQRLCWWLTYRLSPMRAKRLRVGECPCGLPAALKSRLC